MKAAAKAVAIIAAGAIAACTATPAHRPAAQPGVLRIAVYADPKSLNPVLDPHWPALGIAMFAYSWAVRFDANARPFPDALREVPTLANGDVSRDGLTLRYKLRRNARWQDGAPLTCADLRFTWQAVMNPHNDVTTTEGYRDIGAIDCRDPFVAVIRMKRVYAPFLQQLWSIDGYAPILPAHLLARYNDMSGSFNTAAYNALPVGSGPFRIVAWKRGEEVRLTANPRFYLGRPHLSAVVFEIVPDANTAEIELREGGVDLLSASELNWPRFAALAADPKSGLAAQRADQFVWTHVDFNVRQPVVGERAVRLALADAVDRGAIVGKLFHGVPLAARSDQHPLLSWAYTPAAARGYDPAAARRLLERDGWVTGPDGVRVKHGRRLEFSLSACSEYKGEVATEMLLQQQWRAVGADARIKNYSHNLFFGTWPAGVLASGRYDVAVASTSAGPDPDRRDLYSSGAIPPRGENTMRWNDAIATTALNRALRTVDVSQRKREYAVVASRIAIDVPTIVLNFIRSPFLYDRNLRGFDPSPVYVFWDPWRYAI